MAVTDAAMAMKTLRILMIEDNPWVGFVLQELIAEMAQAEITALRSVAAAEKELESCEFDFAFLDVNVIDGKTYGIAASLIDHQIPFAFMSGIIRRDDVPQNLRHAPFLSKPYRPAQIRAILGCLAD